MNIPKTVKTIGANAFAYTGLKELVINGVTTIGENAFNDCSSLYKVIMTGVTTISNGAFYGCSSLANITIDAKNINYNAFGECASLTSVTFSKSVKTISYRAFYYCNALSSATYMDTNNWYRNGLLKDVTNPATNASLLKSDSYYYDWVKK